MEDIIMGSPTLAAWINGSEWGKAGTRDSEGDLGEAGAESEALFLARKSGRGAPREMQEELNR